MAHDPSEAGFSGADPEYAGMYLHARYFDPQLGTFLSPDPMHPALAGVGLNRYSYVFGDPMNRVDRRGLNASMCIEGSDAQCYVREDIEVKAQIPFDWLWAALQNYMFGIWNPAVPQVATGDLGSEPNGGNGSGGNSGKEGAGAQTEEPDKSKDPEKGPDAAPPPKKRSSEEFRSRVCQAYLRDLPRLPNPSGSRTAAYGVKDGIGGGTFLSPAASAYTAAEYGLLASTAVGAISFVLGRSGVAAATLTHGAHTAEKAMLGAELGLHLFVAEPESELQWVPWGDTTGCAP